MIKFQSGLHSPTTPHTSPLRASYGASFMSYTQKNYCDISKAWCIWKKSQIWMCHMRSGLIPRLHPANERRRYKVTTSVIGWAQIQNQPCEMTCRHHHQTLRLSSFDITSLCLKYVSDLHPHTTQLGVFPYNVMMATWHLNTFHITGPLCGECTCEFHAQKISNALMIFFLLAGTRCWTNSSIASDFRPLQLILVINGCGIHF